MSTESQMVTHSFVLVYSVCAWMVVFLRLGSGKSHGQWIYIICNHLLSVLPEGRVLAANDRLISSYQSDRSSESRLLYVWHTYFVLLLFVSFPSLTGL